MIYLPFISKKFFHIKFFVLSFLQLHPGKTTGLSTGGYTAKVVD
jgi:hypothetical protein